ncbi:DoxX family membrane protein [Halospeciosus flavus]|uniref:DoxX family membrane protein n=1 Tax=Halospeciosus flavus TaxID=3032283 RepID=A0ABD5Z4W9_9EURY|nr:DoxX family membrane protein [Halospeciosus flavus]
MAVTGTAAVVLLLGRLLFGGVLAFMGLNHFMQTEQLSEYAEYKGVPAPKLSVLASGAVLVLGGLGIVLGVFPTLAGIVVAAALVVMAVTMHDFWAVPEEQKQDEMTGFLKNTVIAGGALAIAALGWQNWAYAVDVGLF